MTRHRKQTQTSPGKNIPVKNFQSGSPQLKKMEFSLEALSAKSVKLAADFTDWEKSPIEMTRNENGVWRAAVPLASGNYSYRFIVDGQWQDDPHCACRTPNPFGTTNGMLQVAA